MDPIKLLTSLVTPIYLDLLVYMQVRFNLIYVSEISYLTVHLHKKSWKDANFDMTCKQEIKKAMVGHEKDAHLNKKKMMIKKTIQDVCGKT